MSADGTTAYVLLNQNNTLAVIDLTKSQPTVVQEIKVGNAPNSIVLSGNRAYVSNEGGRVAKPVISPIFPPVSRSSRTRKPTLPALAQCRW